MRAIRFEHIARSALPAGRFGQPALDEDAVWSTNPKISGAWFLRPADSRGWTKLRFGAGTGIKPPTAFELAFTNNPGLKPERSRSFDVGVEQALVGSALVADLTWFANRYDDLIVSVGTRSAAQAGIRPTTSQTRAPRASNSARTSDRRSGSRHAWRTRSSIRKC